MGTPAAEGPRQSLRKESHVHEFAGNSAAELSMAVSKTGTFRLFAGHPNTMMLKTDGNAPGRVLTGS
jgi:hypothetical protein